MRALVQYLAIAVCVIGAVLAAPSEARAKRGKLLILPLDAAGFPDDVVEALDAAIRKEADASADLSLMPKPAIGLSGMAMAAGCSEKDGADCVAKIGRTLGATKVFLAGLSGSLEEATLSLSLVRSKDGDEQTLTRSMSQLSTDSGEEMRVHVAAIFGVTRTPPPGTISLYVASRIGTLEGAEIILDDSKTDPAGLSKVSAGTHRVEVRQAGFESFIWEGLVRPGRASRIGVQFTPAASSEVPLATTIPPDDEPEPEASVTVPVESDGRGPRVFTWILSGGAVVAGVVGTIFGVQKLSLQTDINDAQDARNNACRMGDLSACNSSVCDDELRDDCDSADTAATVATVSWVLAGAFAAGGIAAFFLETSGGDDPAFEAAVAPSKDGASASLRIRF